MTVKKLACVLVCLLLCASVASAQEEALLHGYDETARQYEYATFGVYPYGENGEEAPLLWRVLGQGVPGEDDIISKDNYPSRKEKKYANQDELTEDNDDIFLLMTEYISSSVNVP